MMSKYKLKDFLGFGSFGMVFSAEFPQPIAVKFLNPIGSASQSNSLRECEIMSRPENSHLNLVKILQSTTVDCKDVSNDIIRIVENAPSEIANLSDRCLVYHMSQIRSSRGTMRCIEMELCGPTLRCWLNNPLLYQKFTMVDPFVFTAHIAADIITGLKFLHSKKVLHRDLKPDNIYFSHGGNHTSYTFLFPVKIGDFGTCRDVPTTQTVPQTSQVFSERYRAREARVYDENGKLNYGGNADWYSVGLILYELFYLFGKTEVVAAFDELINERQLRSNIHYVGMGNLNRIILGLTEKQSDKRKKTIDTLMVVEDVQRFLMSYQGGVTNCLKIPALDGGSIAIGLHFSIQGIYMYCPNDNNQMDLLLGPVQNMTISGDDNVEFSDGMDGKGVKINGYHEKPCSISLLHADKYLKMQQIMAIALLRLSQIAEMKTLRRVTSVILVIPSTYVYSFHLDLRMACQMIELEMKFCRELNVCACGFYQESNIKDPITVAVVQKWHSHVADFQLRDSRVKRVTGPAYVMNEDLPTSTKLADKPHIYFVLSNDVPAILAAEITNQHPNASQRKLVDAVAYGWSLIFRDEDALDLELGYNSFPRNIIVPWPTPRPLQQDKILALIQSFQINHLTLLNKAKLQRQTTFREFGLEMIAKVSHSTGFSEFEQSTITAKVTDVMELVANVTVDDSFINAKMNDLNALYNHFSTK